MFASDITPKASQRPITQIRLFGQVSGYSLLEQYTHRFIHELGIEKEIKTPYLHLEGFYVPSIDEAGPR